jgi:hypothetical protein
VVSYNFEMSAKYIGSKLFYSPHNGGHFPVGCAIISFRFIKSPATICYREVLSALSESGKRSAAVPSSLIQRLSSVIYTEVLPLYCSFE